MSTVYTIPNRPTGGAPRAIADIIADFDSVLAALNSFDGGNIQVGTLPVTALPDASIGTVKLIDSSVTSAKLATAVKTAGGDLSGTYPNPTVDYVTPTNNSKRHLAIGNANVVFPGGSAVSNETSVVVPAAPAYCNVTQKGAFGLVACFFTWRVIDGTHIGITGYCASGSPSNGTVANADYEAWV